MFGAVNLGLKKSMPGLHHLLKRSAQRIALPSPKMLLGRPVWTHFRLRNQVIGEERVLRWIAEYLTPGDVFFDVGAHQGWMSMVAARRTGPLGRVVAFEPTPS